MVSSDGGGTVKVLLDPFTLGSVEGRFGAEPRRGVEAAARHYALRLRSQSPPPEVPLFMRGEKVDPATATEIQVTLPDDVHAALSQEARRQGVDSDRIVAHAVFVFVHDIEAGDRVDVDPAEEDGDLSRYGGHAKSQISGARRPHGTAGGDGLLRRGGSAGGRSRFGRR
jgi:hypothetical protein